ncbi:MAG: CoA-binding protein [Bacteroidota bacterium]
MQKKTLVIGASADPSRYSHMAITMLREHDHPVIAIGKRSGSVADVEIQKESVAEKNIDTVTLYINPVFQKEYYDYIISLHPKRIIFNPGTENAELYELAKSVGIDAIEACTLVLLRTSQY